MNWDAIGAVTNLVGATGHFQFRTGTLAEGDWYEIRAVLHYWLQGRGCRDWWAKLGQHMFGREFIAFIEAEMTRIDEAAPINR